MDQALFHLINERWTHPALDLFMAGISDSEIWKPLLIGIVLFVLIFGGFKARACVFCLVLALSFSELVLVRNLKAAVDRKRPKQVQKVRMVVLEKARPKVLSLFKKPTIRYSGAKDRKSSGPSFPSGHTTNNTIIAVILTLFYPRRGWLYFLVAAAVGYSRIYLGAHWPSDVLATIFMATGAALIVVGLLELLWQKGARRWWPELFARHPRLVGPRVS